MNIRETSKYLVGSTAIYVAMAACGGGGGRGHDSLHSEGGARALHSQAGEMSAVGGNGMAQGGQLHEGGQTSSGGPEAGGLLDPVPVASAAPVELCATCRGTALQTVTADTDPQQEATGIASLAAAPLDKRSTAKVADGPLFVVYADTPDKVNYYTVNKDQSCAFDPEADDDAAGENSGGSFAPTFAPHHRPAGTSLARSGSASAKLRVFSNEKLCVSQVADCSCQVSPAPRSGSEHKLTWFGYRPYE